MPNYYIPRRVPPSTVDRTLANPFGVFFSSGSIMVAALLAISAATGATPTPAFAGLSPITVVAIGVALFIGGSQTLRGIYHIRGGKWSKPDAIGVELSGSIALALAWLAYSITAATSGNESTAIMVYGTLFIFAGFAARGFALLVSLLDIRDTGNDLKEEEEGEEGEEL